MHRRAVRSRALVVVTSMSFAVLGASCSGRVRTGGAGDDDGVVVGEGEGEGEGTAVDGACAAPTNKPLPSPSAVYSGTRDPTHVPLDDAQRLAIIALGTGQPPGSECSGTLITSTIVLTARHCTEGVAASDFYVSFGDDDYAPELTLRVTEKVESPDYDVTLLRLESAPAEVIAVRPIPISVVDLADADVGTLNEQAGFGQTDNNTSGLYFVAEPFDGFEGEYLVVNGEGRHGVCFGDSGGPSMRIDASGATRVVGALSWGDESCTGRDRYTRVDLVRTFIEETTGPTPGSAAQPCGDVDARGACNVRQSLATYCAADVLQHDVCAAGQVCADTRDGARCVATEAAPCGAATSFGACDGDLLTWCRDGVAVTRDCGACDEVCIEADSATGFACVPSSCGDLTYLGECDGNTARWCESGSISTRDCAAQGSTCGYIDDETGYFCR